MRKELIEAAGMTLFAEVGLIIFVAVFVLIFLRALLMKSPESEQLAALPLHDDAQPSEEVSP